MSERLRKVKSHDRTRRQVTMVLGFHPGFSEMTPAGNPTADVSAPALEGGCVICSRGVRSGGRERCYDKSEAPIGPELMLMISAVAAVPDTC